MLKSIHKFLIVALLLSTIASYDIDYSYSYEDFIRQFPRHYKGTEKALHQQIFKKNYANLIKLWEKGQDVVVTDFLDWTDQEKERFFNYKPHTANIPLSTRPLTSNYLFASPSSFDWRTYGRVTPVKNQGSCGSCWAFSSTAEYESKLAIATNGTIYDLAEQYALQCQTSFSSGCNGGIPYYALKLFETNGIPLESTFPYSPSTGYGNICSSTGKIKLNQTVNNVTFAYFQNVPAEQLQQDLVAYGPINVGVYASDPSFYSAGPTGLISCAPASSINHAILLVGYNTTHWFIKNSWATSWGNNGYGYISKSNDCNIRQYVSEMQVNFGFQPTPPLPDPNAVNLTITMTDLSSNGWNGNVLAVRQNNTLVGTFGANFTTGNASGPVYIVVQGYSQVQIVVNQLGTNPSEIGFVIKAPNGTTIYQRASGTAFDASTVFTTFCPLGGCPATLLLTVTMTDSFGDGWNGNVLGFQQNGAVVGAFGAGFTAGASSGPLFISVVGNQGTKIVVNTLGTKTNEIGFVVKAPNGTIIHSRASGTAFVDTTVFLAFCPIGGCPTTLDLTITMTDLYGDGWNGNVIGIKQNDTIVGTFGGAFTAGSSSGPVTITVLGNLGVQIVITQLGAWTQEVGFIVKAPNGTIIYQRNSGATFNETTLFSTFCPVGPCTNLLTLTITMTDSLGDGWNWNILGIRQNNFTVGTFGGAFTTGLSSGPIYITVLGNYQAQIFVFQLGSRKTSQMGFVVKAPNGTIIYQRAPGTAFTISTIFSIFCPIGGCLNRLNLTITMTDSYGDGWNGNVLGIKQNNVMVGTFGANFTNGSSSGPVYIVVQGNIQAQVVVSTFASWTAEVGFIIKAPNGTIIFQRTSGTSYSSSLIFTTFCPVGGCYINPNVTYYLTNTDSSGDGWQGTILAFKQNGATAATFTLASGASDGPTPYSFQKMAMVNVTVYVLGNYTNQIGLELRNAAGVLVFQKTPGPKFFGNAVIGSFCPDCTNLDHVTTLSNTTQIRQQPTPQSFQSSQPLGPKPYIIATYTLLTLTILFAIIASIFIYKFVQLSRNQSVKNITANNNQIIESAKSFGGPGSQVQIQI